MLTALQLRRGLIGTMILLAIPAFAQVPEPVSPGSRDHVAHVRDGCPVFSWTLAPGGTEYEIAVYEVGASETTGSAGDRLVLRRRLPANSTSWTPSLGSCLEAGNRYAWSVRAGSSHGMGEWSEGSLFEVEAPRAEMSVEDAIEVLKRYASEQESMNSHPKTKQNKEEPQSPVSQANLRALFPSVSAVTGPAAIRGELGGTTGAILGVAGVTQSPDGAGLAAANTAGGADLVLDGSSQGATGAAMTESGLDRPSSSAETFDIKNSGGGGMTLLVDGQPAATTSTDVWVKKSGDTMTGTLTLSPSSGKAWVANGDVELSGRLYKGQNIFLHAPDIHDTAVGGSYCQILCMAVGLRRRSCLLGLHR